MPRGTLSSARLALLVGLVGVGVVSLVFETIPWDVPAEVPALLLLVTVVLSSVLSSWRIGVPVAVVAGVSHALLFIPPRGVVRLGYTQDTLTLGTFVAVSLVVSVLVSRRSIQSHAELIGHERMLLLRSVSHDIRSPLNVILTASTELRDGADHDAATRHRLLGLVVDEARRLDRIVDNMLNLGRLQAGALVPAVQRIGLADLLDESVARLRRHLGPNDRLVLDSIPDVDVMVDPVQIDQVVSNLVENAVRHGGTPAVVTLAAAVSGPLVHVDVSDEGVGMTEAARTRLFDPFHSTDNSSGLGLTVCNAVVEAHGGTMSVSASPSGGTTISFSVPRAD